MHGANTFSRSRLACFGRKVAPTSAARQSCRKSNAQSCSSKRAPLARRDKWVVAAAVLEEDQDVLASVNLDYEEEVRSSPVQPQKIIMRDVAHVLHVILHLHVGRAMLA